MTSALSPMQCSYSSFIYANLGLASRCAHKIGRGSRNGDGLQGHSQAASGIIAIIGFAQEQ